MKTPLHLNTILRVEGNNNEIYVTSIKDIVAMLSLLKELYVTSHHGSKSSMSMLFHVVVTCHMMM